MSRRFPLFIAALTIAAFPSFGQRPCESLKTLTVPGLTIDSATSVTAGSFTLPTRGARNATVQVPDFCRVSGVIAPESKFELWMPAQWNHKFLTVGNGGLAGSISYAPMVVPLQQGYATSSTDTGHDGNSNDGSWALGHFERVVDFAHRSVHTLAETDKILLQTFYGNSPSHSYFSGCSAGGMQAMQEAQRYPMDYDGIIAGDPANNWVHHYIGGHLWAALAMTGDGYIPTSKIQLIADAVNNACDALDGIKDGVLNDPRRCHFDPATLACKQGDAANCLTNAQVQAVKKLWTGLRTADGDQLYPPLVPGGEAGPGGWANWMAGTEPGKGGHANLGIPFLKFVVFADPNWDYRSFRFDAPPGLDNDVDFADAKVGAMFNAMNPDLSAFRARGGKLIHYHGWSDPDITPLNSVNYYESVAKEVSHGGNHGLRDTREFYRLFMVPGMQHCGGGPGTTNFNMLDALDKWVDHGAAPDKIIASHLTNGTVDRTRPLCPYPMEAQWTGSGSTDQAENFVCALPSAP
ncbi:MAG TPA: tannase/feruloyl esterase family alpha/beta hydrolase [Bryobacteraceae bacterium]|nr:tannase/feruloyl esterase family alpha/beta hydrolase [Bryobacteraceae bacterium]